jgi:ABC-type xylose transport system permease subunit
MGVASYYQYLIKGVIMVAAVYFDIRGRANM